MAASNANNPSSRKPRVNLKDLKKLIDMMRKAELSEVNIEQEGIKIALKKGADAQVLMAPQAYAPAPMVAAPAAAAPAAAMAPAAGPAAAPAPAAASAASGDGPSIKSPMVGTFYRASSPDAEPYAKEGTRVEVGQTVCIIEAMKLMNEIKAEVAGTITKVLVENAQPVEFGQPLFVIKP
jgi:acetyl-CoA carboxylase biotin carboxyl carrier protein